MSESKQQSKSAGRKRQGSGSKRNRNRKKTKYDPQRFWGDMDALPTPEQFVTDSPEPLAVVHSLGRAPLQGVTAEPYFAAVYDRAAALAGVLSDAAGLDDLTPLEPTEAANGEANRD